MKYVLVDPSGANKYASSFYYESYRDVAEYLSSEAATIFSSEEIVEAYYPYLSVYVSKDSTQFIRSNISRRHLAAVSCAAMIEAKINRGRSP